MRKIQYKILAESNPMKGKVFLGHCVIIGGESRIWNDDSMGQSYPACDCVPILMIGKYTFEIGNVNTGLDHLYDEKGNMIYHCSSVIDIYCGLKYNNAVSISRWEYEVKNYV